jgi:hypothetical protein
MSRELTHRSAKSSALDSRYGEHLEVHQVSRVTLGADDTPSAAIPHTMKGAAPMATAIAVRYALLLVMFVAFQRRDRFS